MNGFSSFLENKRLRSLPCILDKDIPTFTEIATISKELQVPEKLPLHTVIFLKQRKTKMWKFLGRAASNLFITQPAPENRQKALKKLIPKMMPFYQLAKQ